MTTTLVTATPDPETSREFYLDTGFTPLGPHTFGATGLTIRIDPTRTARAAVVLHGDPGERRAALEAVGRVVERKDRSLITSDPNGVLLVLDPTGAPSVQEVPPSLLGGFAGLSIEAVDPERTTHFWEAAGWKREKGDPGQGWVSLGREEGFGLSIMGMEMCPHLFPNPGITFFNSGRNPAIIAALRDRGVPFAEEVTVFNDQGEVDNVVLRDPGGLGFFVFND